MGIDPDSGKAWRLYEHLAETLDADSMLIWAVDIPVGRNGPLSPRVPYSVGTYLWLSIGIARHPEGQLQRVESAKESLSQATLLLTPDLIETAERMYERLTRNDPRVQRYHVREAQRLLTELGHSPGPVDGQWGPRSQRAFDAWRSASGARTGKVGIGALREMRSALAAARPTGHSLVRFVCQQSVDLEDMRLRGSVWTGGWDMMEDGIYKCGEPVLIPWSDPS